MNLEIMVTFGECGGSLESGRSDRPGKFGDSDDTGEFGDFAVGDFVELKYCNQIMKMSLISFTGQPDPLNHQIHQYL